MMKKTYYAHSANKNGDKQTAKHHVEGVTHRAEEAARIFHMEEEARLAGLLHDIGKYSERFARRLQGLEKGLDHWSAGAWLALTKFKSIAATLAIQGHHIGLQKGDRSSLRALAPAVLSANHPLGLELTETNTDLLFSRLLDDGFTPCCAVSPVMPNILASASAMLDVRMLFSTLVDGDFLDTEEHMKAGDPGADPYRPVGTTLDPAAALDALQRHLDKLAAKSQASDAVIQMRGELMQVCRAAGQGNQSLFTLTAPTGTGKTLAMLAFALMHAQRHGLRRIVVVLPFLSIIDQTASVYREVFAEFEDSLILEHHSLSQNEPTDTENEKQAVAERRRQERLLTENWDAPIIITTSVQMLESLFANRPGACRKLHHLAQSVILFDEVQTLPLPLAAPTLKTLSRMAQRFRSTIVFATATQPAFGRLDEQVKETGENSGWQPQEIVPADLNLYARAKRTHVDWSYAQTPTSWENVAKWINVSDQALCIVNLKRHAVELYKLLDQAKSSGLCHLSTSMCPAHRQKVLEAVSQALSEKRPCRLVSTQCVEAGVDVDFPTVYRSFGPLDSVAQAAGRCNRHDNLTELGRVCVFLPESGGQVLYPPGGYEQAADVTRLLLREFGDLDIHDPNVFLRYFSRLYGTFPPDATIKAKQLAEAIKEQNYCEVARLYKVIENDSVNVLVCYNQSAYDHLADEVRLKGLTSGWIRRARPHVVSLFRSKDKPFSSLLEPIRLRNGEDANDWFIYCEPPSQTQPHYDPELGLNPPESSGAYMV